MREKMKKTGAVIPAAGLSRRMGAFKPMLPFENSTISRHIIQMLQSLGIEQIIVVTGYRAEELEDHLKDLSVQFVRNTKYGETEMLDSVRLGLLKAEKQCEQIIVMPMDIPGIEIKSIQKVLCENAKLARTMCGGKPGHPLLICREAVKSICNYRGDKGVKGAMEESGIPIVDVIVEDVGVYEDVDTPEEYENVKERHDMRRREYR